MEGGAAAGGRVKQLQKRKVNNTEQLLTRAEGGAAAKANQCSICTFRHSQTVPSEYMHSGQSMHYFLILRALLVYALGILEHGIPGLHPYGLQRFISIKSGHSK